MGWGGLRGDEDENDDEDVNVDDVVDDATSFLSLYSMLQDHGKSV
jgi:hypothetical protein